MISPMKLACAPGVKPLRRSMRRQALRGTLHAAGMRLTRQRLAIYRELESRCDHPDVEHIYLAVKPRIPRISLFTVYRTVNALESAGILQRVATWRGHARYDACVDRHAHFLCESCGKIEDVETGDLEFLNDPAGGQARKIRRVDVLFRGEGQTCCSTTLAWPESRCAT